jgi:hypothetical protein
MPISEALEEADRIKKEEQRVKSCMNAERYRKEHMEYKAQKNREYRARKKLQAEALAKN